jgi:hypothetical protein
MSNDPKWLEAQVAAQLAALREIESTLDPDYLRLVRDAAAAAAEWNRQMQEMKATRELERDFLPKLARHGWLLSPSGPADQPERLHGLYEEGGIAAVDLYLDERLDVAACREIVDDISKRAVFAPWRPTFDKALAALERGDHELAIPIWLAALESACWKELGVKDFYSAKVQTKRNAVAAQLASLSMVYEPIAIAWLEVLLGFSGKRTSAGPAILNRHAVMHGNRPGIGTRKDALQCLLALEVLSYLIDARDYDAARHAGAAPARGKLP